ncbi:hypothetical protein BHE74_00057679 [Ensete ventricosum]|nr:hypothetical protein BHE74_00057679 [Ensete ventricosum]RZS17850.1 hypothetical protein BHM03_00050049 [Ensete ventricosum]
MVSRTSMVSQKNTTVTKFMRNRAQSYVSIGFSSIVSKIQNTGHSHLISPWEVIRARFPEKIRRL